MKGFSWNGLVGFVLREDDCEACGRWTAGSESGDELGDWPGEPDEGGMIMDGLCGGNRTRDKWRDL